MKWVRDIGPSALASITLALAAYGFAHQWDAYLILWALAFAMILPIVSLLERGARAIVATVA